MNKSFFQDVAEFHEKFKLPVCVSSGGTVHPAMPNERTINYRLNFLVEEIIELEKGCAAGDLAQVADALADIVYVALGTAHYFGIPFHDVWNEVQRANMAKALKSSGDPEHKRGAVEVIIKPEGWQPPDIQAIIDRVRHSYGR